MLIPILILAVVLFVIKAMAPFEWAKIMNALKKGTNHGVAVIQGAGNSVQVVVADFNKPLGGWFKDRDQAFDLTNGIMGNKKGVPFGVYNAYDIKAKYTWKSEGEPISSKALSSFGIAAEEMGKIEKNKNERLVIILCGMSVLFILLLLPLAFLAMDNANHAYNAAVAVQGQLSNLSTQITVSQALATNTSGIIIPTPTG